MATQGRALASTLLAGLVLAGAGGCGTTSSTSDAKIISALDLKESRGAYEMGGDPFCTVDKLLNDSDEVDAAKSTSGQEFVISSPTGEVGVVAQKPFAPDCSRRAKDELRRLSRQSSG
jgi:hypothetical protein